MEPNLDFDFVHVEQPLHPTQTTQNGMKIGPSFEQPVLSLSESIQHARTALYTAQKTALIIASSEKKNESKAKSAAVQLKKTKTLLAQKFESLREPIHSAYRHSGDFVLICQATSQERNDALNSCLVSAKALHLDFSRVHSDFTQTLDNFERQKPTFLVSQLQSETNASTTEAVDELSISLHAIAAHLQEIVSFWEEHSRALSHDTRNPNPTLFDDSSNDPHRLAQTWFGYQKRLLDASSSIAESVDAMSVEPAVNLQHTTLAPNSSRVEEGSGFLHGLWKLIAWMDFRR